MPSLSVVENLDVFVDRVHVLQASIRLLAIELHGLFFDRNESVTMNHF